MGLDKRMPMRIGARADTPLGCVGRTLRIGVPSHTPICNLKAYVYAFRVQANHPYYPGMGCMGRPQRHRSRLNLEQWPDKVTTLSGHCLRINKRCNRYNTLCVSWRILQSCMAKNQICGISLQIKAHWPDSFFYWGSDTWSDTRQIHGRYCICFSVGSTLKNGSEANPYDPRTRNLVR
jgi:hypothetical protein